MFVVVSVCLRVCCCLCLLGMFFVSNLSAFVCSCVRLCVCVYLHLCTCVCVCMCVCACVCACVSVCLCAGLCVFFDCFGVDVGVCVYGVCLSM